MAKTSQLPLLADLTGDEDVPLLSGGRMKRAKLAKLQGQLTLAGQAALQSIANGQAAFLTLANLYQTVSSGLAATAPDRYFGVASGGEVAITVYQKVNGAAVLVNVLASQAALDRVGRFVPAMLNTDNSVSMNAALGQPLVGGIIMPPADIRLDHALALLPAHSGKFIRGAGIGATRLVRTDNVAASNYIDRGGVVVRGAIGTRVSDFSFVAPKTTTKVQAVWFTEAARFGLCERVEGVNCGYTFWAHEFARFIEFRDVRSINGNVHFETTRATDILFDGMWAEDGDADNPLGVEATWHCLYGSKRVHFRNGRHRGRGQPYLLVADTGVGDEGLIDDITFENLKSKQTDSKIGFFVSRINAGANVGRVTVIDCDLDCTGGGGIPMQLQLGQVTIRGGRWAGNSQENCMVLPEATLDWTNPTMSVKGTHPEAYGSFFAGGGEVTLRGGGRLETDSAIVAIGDVKKITGDLDYVAPGAAGLIYIPPIGKPCRRVFPVDMAYNSSEVFGSGYPNEGRIQLGLPDGQVFKIRMRGRVTPRAAGDPKLVGVFVDGLGGTIIAGGITVQTAPDTYELHNAYPGYGGFGKAYEGDGATFDLDITVRGAGGTMTLGAYGNIVLAAGSEFVIERII